MEYTKINKLKIICALLMIFIAMLACFPPPQPPPPSPKDTFEEEWNEHVSCEEKLDEGLWVNCVYYCDNGAMYPDSFDENTMPEEAIDDFCNLDPRALGDKHIWCNTIAATEEETNGDNIFFSDCTYTCDNGEKYPNTFDENTKPPDAEIALFCGPAAASVVEETIATEEPTEAPTEEPAALPAPILTGDVTYCDAETHIINLRFVDGFNVENLNHQLSMGGVPMTCSFNQTNSTLLTCSYPATVLFPTSIKVEDSNGSVVNEFEFNGSNCSVPVQSKEKQNEDGTESEGSGGSGDACANDTSPSCLVIYCQYHPTEAICNN